MAIIKETVQVFFGGINIELIKGNEIQDNSPLVKAKPELFEIKEVIKPKSTKKKVQAKKEPKEELLVEEPVAALEVTEVEEVVETPTEEVVEETKPRRRKRK